MERRGLERISGTCSGPLDRVLDRDVRVPLFRTNPIRRQPCGCFGYTGMSRSTWGHIGVCRNIESYIGISRVKSPRTKQLGIWDYGTGNCNTCSGGVHDYWVPGH